MINNMRRDTSLVFEFFLSMAIVALIATACTKKSTSGGNKSYLGVTNLSPQAPPLDIYFDSALLNTSGSLSFGSTTGAPGNPYLTAIAGVHSIKLTSGSQILLDGNTALQVNNHYSMFVYDSAGTSSLNTLILQDPLTLPPDTVSLVRFLNFTDTTFYLTMTNAIDTFVLLNQNVRPNASPSSFTFNYVKPGAYQVRAVIDSVDYFNLDSLSFSGSTMYSVYMLQLPNFMSTDSLYSGVIRHN